MIRLSLAILCMILVVSCCSCGLFGDQRYVCEVDNVESIQIVRLGKYLEEEYRFEYTVLAQISDCTTFVKLLNQVEHSVNWGDPYPLNAHCVVIKIDYRNGDFDLVHKDAQCFNRAGVNQNGYFFFDEEQFDSLVSSYISDGAITES